MAKYVLGEQGARRFHALCAPKTESGSIRGGGTGVADPLNFAMPYTVRWAQSVGSSGSWIIWLPDGNLLIVEGVAVDVTTDLEAAGGDYPDGWYQLADISESVILGVRVPNEGSPSATISGSEITPSSDEQAINITIASVTRDDDAGSSSVVQFVSSVIALGGANGVTAPSPFRIVRAPIEPEEDADPDAEPTVGMSVVDCKFNFNGSAEEVADYAVPQGASAVWLVGVETSGAWSWRLDTTPETPTLQNVVYNQKLYDLDGTEVTMDYRTTFQTAVRGVYKITGQDSAGTGAGYSLSGDVSISGYSQSGIIVRSDQRGLHVDLAGRGAADRFALHSLKSADGSALAKFLSTADVQIGGGITADATFDIIVGIRYDIPSGYIQVKTRTATVQNGVIVSVGAASDWTNSIGTTPHSI